MFKVSSIFDELGVEIAPPFRIPMEYTECEIRATSKPETLLPADEQQQLPSLPKKAQKLKRLVIVFVFSQPTAQRRRDETCKKREWNFVENAKLSWFTRSNIPNHQSEILLVGFAVRLCLYFIDFESDKNEEQVHLRRC